MTQDLLTGLLLFAFVSSITPGPNNLMLLSSGANYGFRKSVPHMLGISVGHSFMVFLVGIGLMGLFEAVPLAHDLLTLAGIGYLLWLAWKIAHAGAPGTGDARGKPFSFLQAAAFQWVNPKAWQMAMTAITLYAPDRSLWGVAMVAGIFACTNLPSISLWTVLGQNLRAILARPARLQAFNWTMAILLVASLVPVVWPMLAH
ncbi:MAG TPA: hypothetical protein DEF12_07645 [Rhodobacteraceae bacterium]|jgi:threonine/homoserine/homoserine lactone efflux protein|nr:hypothetical protein [Paracoccaceae bacterium]HBV54894.1 hypothetical protein [Paracoccaceae bacterium]